MPDTAAPTGASGATAAELVQFVVDGEQVEVPVGPSLLDALRDHLGRRSVKDGCSPQGQCGCCTVLVDGAPRVACVTPVRRVAGRTVTTLDGLEPRVRDRWAEAFLATGASQCGFCTPGIVLRLEGLREKGTAADDHAAVGRALAAHLCRCTGWQTIEEAWDVVAGGAAVPFPATRRNLDAAARRATIEGRADQHVSAAVALGQGGFADDSAPAGALVAVPDGDGGWAVGESLAEARAAAGKRQGRRTTLDPAPPLELPVGDWAVTLRTSWVDPAYLETDAAWCAPGATPRGPLGNGGAFGAKRSSPVEAVARELADRHGRPVRVLLSREDTVTGGPKRPPIAAGLRPDGSGVVRAVRTAGLAEAFARWAPELEVEPIDMPGPPTSLDLRAAGWAELGMLRAGLAGRALLATDPDGGEAEADVVDGRIRVRVSCGDPLDPVVLRSYCIGASHMAYSWVTSEGLSVDADGTVGDLTVRSFGVVRALDTPEIVVEIDDSPAALARPPVNGSDAVFAAVAAAVWIDHGCPQDLPATGRKR
jgi:aerobic-type carbon monoxide dehydrogenase small subunit (CoxS/CutS family)